VLLDHQTKPSTKFVEPEASMGAFGGFPSDLQTSIDGRVGSRTAASIAA
jgi:hypothetical protein